MQKQRMVSISIRNIFDAVLHVEGMSFEGPTVRRRSTPRVLTRQTDTELANRLETNETSALRRAASLIRWQDTM